jgi:DNA repair protein RadC
MPKTAATSPCCCMAGRDNWSTVVKREQGSATLITKQQLIKVATVSQGSVNESLDHPREIFKPVITHSAYSFILVHNHPSGDPSPSEAEQRLTRRIVEASRILQLHLVDHVIIGSPAPGRSSYFSFKAGGVIS